MHNCKSIRNSFVELALDDLSPAESARLVAELKDCGECREELATIRAALRTSGQALQAALPAEDFWPGYHARLETSLRNSWRHNESLQTGCLRSQPTTRSWPTTRSQRSTLSQAAARTTAWLVLRNLMTTSVRVPAPVAAALLLLFGVAVFFAINSGGAATTKSLTPTLTQSVAGSTRVVEVPVIKERVVTRVVYVETSRRPRNPANDSSLGLDNENAPPIDVAGGVARVRSYPRTAEMSLAGFKPADEVKLTIIKGSDPK